MCGIGGFVGPGEERDLVSMGEALAHRGPDGVGTYVDPPSRLWLVHRRLAILDIEGGHQPMWNETGDVCVVFNGEIFNHLELRRMLEARGHVFRSDHSDTEVLVHGYEEWGSGLPALLNGMFSFAVYDRRARTLFLARDRFGKKPLYYYASAKLFAFASELTALMCHQHVPREIDSRSVQKFFAYGFIPAPNSLYKHVKKLPGGHCLHLECDTGRVQITEYWRFRIEPRADVPANAEQVWGEELRALLSEAVRRRMSTDVPLGVFLSGGIDSSAVLAFATRHAGASGISTFSIGFAEPSFDESGYARLVAAYFGSKHHEEILSIERARELVPELLSRIDEPIGDSSIIPTYLLCRFARSHVTVALGGDGGDELFAGYAPFKALNLARAYSAAVPGWLHKKLRSCAELIPPSDRYMSLEFKLKRALRGMSYPCSLWNPVWLGPVDAEEIRELCAEPLSQEDLYSEALQAWEQSRADNLVDKSLEFYTRLYLQDDILTKVDRASMLVSLEVRAPFLDNDVVEFARTLPHHFKYRNGQTKYLLKKALEGVLPREILKRKKQGFGMPLARWLREWQELPLVPVKPFRDLAQIRQRWEDHRARRVDHRLMLWCWLALQHHVARAGT